MLFQGKKKKEKNIKPKPLKPQHSAMTRAKLLPWAPKGYQYTSQNKGTKPNLSHEETK